MSQEKSAEIQNRIQSLKAELDALSLKLQQAAVATDVAADESLTTETQGKLTREGDSTSSLRTLRDLMWQGRWSLAFHLAKALEGQDVRPEFASSTIKAWTLAVTAERRSGFEASALIQELCRPAQNTESLSERMLKWAALIGLLRAVDPSEVRACASLFTPPEELAATSGWWLEYVAALASAARPAARWLSMPQQDLVTGEINQLMIECEIEPTRLAASCLMMSVKTAMRRVHIASVAEARFVLNSELARRTSVTFDENGEVSSSAADVERAVCEMAASSAVTETPLVTEGPATARNETIVPESLIEAPTPRAQLTLERLEALEESLHSEVNDNAPTTVAPDETLRETRRQAARERLKRYSERLAARGKSPATIPMRTMSARPETTATASATVASASPVGSAPQAPKNDEAPNPVATAVRPIESAATTEPPAPTTAASRTVLAADDRRGIHENAVAYVFADAGRNTGRAAPASVRPNNDASIWTALFTPQAAIVAGLMVIASAIIAGFGSGLSAQSIVTGTAAESTPKESTTADAGDFQAVQ